MDVVLVKIFASGFAVRGRRQSPPAVPVVPPEQPPWGWADRDGINVMRTAGTTRPMSGRVFIWAVVAL
jgi:hypothetical protein